MQLHAFATPMVDNVSNKGMAEASSSSAAALPSFVHLTPRQSCALHGWWTPKRTLHWDDVISNSTINLSKCLQCGLSPQQLKEVQPDVSMWIDFKGVSFQVCRIWDMARSALIVTVEVQ